MFNYYKENNQIKNELPTALTAPIYFKYPKKKYYTFSMHFPFTIKSEFIGEQCNFYVITSKRKKNVIRCDINTGDLKVNTIVYDTFIVVCKNEVGELSTTVDIASVVIGEGYKSNREKIIYYPQLYRVVFSDNTYNYFVFDYCFTEGVNGIKCLTTLGLSIKACTTRENKDEIFMGNINKNVTYDILSSGGVYCIIFDLKNRRIGYMTENSNEMKVIHKNIQTPLYLMIENSYSISTFQTSKSFEIQNFLVDC